ncbi:MAG: histidine--tRNA ligase [Candidatus Doudnabacteria bacterium CG10_big_fil_rev_8_21_14_0_10_42_18]|uniref:Histidine--tRNA ligase n=1 Tax=Candidatus Doudnabacteria bacterium CG10_big_fil_rev_8_21_14_0_10_42_18 TaxID=1974552 RepID=A0A2H0VCL6_9BACT|nr:MAG: histidine--tRNA ligase [Candidatus Doudnabacteria bacterium CG10_big_fil_rev_8_21_14_0_10_42_18]
MKPNKKLSLEPYKGTRDFYPKDQFVQNYIFGVWKKVAERYGYQEYNSSILEETDLYRAKTGEEIVNEQTYSFTDRGGRDVTIRPEMTPTVARMVAAKRRELTFPLRWFSIPNLWRYERPQRGRLREHWQLNCDIFGVDGIEADVEIISLAYDIMKEFGAKDKDFEIRIYNRKLLNYWAKVVGLNQEQASKITKVIDKKDKISTKDFYVRTEEILKEKTEEFIELMQSPKKFEERTNFFQKKEEGKLAWKEINLVFDKLESRGIKNIRLDAALVRGFDYYTGMVFEMYDVNPKNPRALFGGGRYDDLVGIFGVEKVSGVGFGWGDVTTKDFLETYKLLPEFKSSSQLYICHLDGYLDKANELASSLREQGANVEVDLTERKIQAQIKTADREDVPFVLVVGEEEVKSKRYKVKNLQTGKEEQTAEKDIYQLVKKNA